MQCVLASVEADKVDSAKLSKIFFMIWLKQREVRVLFYGLKER